MHFNYQETKNRFCAPDEDPNDIVVFHGIGDIKPIDIYGTTEGVDFPFSNESMWGKASYLCDDLMMLHHYAYSLHYSNLWQFLGMRLYSRPHSYAAARL